MRALIVPLLVAYHLTQAQAPSPSRAALHLAEILYPTSLLQAHESSFVSAYIEAHPNLQAYRDIIEEWEREINSTQIILPRLAQRLAKELSDAEMDSIGAFYESPLGRKLSSARLRLNADLARLSVELQEEYRPELRRKLRARAAALHQRDPLESD